MRLLNHDEKFEFSISVVCLCVISTRGRISDDDKEIVLRYDDNASYIKDFIVDCPNKRLYILNGKMNSLELFQLGTKAPITLLVNLDGIQRIAMDTSHLVIYFLYLNHIEFFTLKDQRRKKLNCACIHRPTAVAIDNDDIYVAEEDRGILKVSSDSLNCTLILNHTGFIPNVAVADNSLTIIDSLHDRVVEMARDTLTIISNTSVTQPRDIHPSSAQMNCDILLIDTSSKVAAIQSTPTNVAPSNCTRLPMTHRWGHQVKGPLTSSGFTPTLL
ncbi:hypothetical protein Btru_047832 [Bulinus truncatus]|nr:hypothetical protein Btru_047832 [Bulinus truncatus]